ncbi:hypothetical protein [Planctomicrobium sp. SH664]|uniref:hypothetical protein n=1 Tax=Planctomicrobium sp. SH664 TaxID=3448125 RepID=UPI003F5AE79D
MIEISLTRFIDFTIKSGSPKFTSLRETKKQSADGYDPVTDYYKQIRDAIVAHHRNGKSFSTIETIAANVSNKSKRDNYPEIAQGYKKFLGRKQVTWFKPPQADWTAHGVSVSVNPELGLEFNGARNVIKLYFKGPEPKKLEVRGILSLMDANLQNSTRTLTMGLLDVRRGKLITDEPPDGNLLALMQGEAASIAAMWPSL